MNIFQKLLFKVKSLFAKVQFAPIQLQIRGPKKQLTLGAIAFYYEGKYAFPRFYAILHASYTQGKFNLQILGWDIVVNEDIG